MVCPAEGTKERDGSDRAVNSMASKPLHNFSLPCLKWGCQRQMRCVRINSPTAFRSPSPASGTEPSPPRSVGDQVRRSRDAVVPNLRIGVGISSDREIKAVKEKVLNDLRAEMDKYLGRGTADSGAAADRGKEGSQGKPWNLRTSRAACKAPIAGGKGRVCQSPQRSEGAGAGAGGGGGNGNLKSMLKPSLRSGAEKKSEERAKFCPTLKRKEMEEDFMMMTGQRPPRKPKKRPRSVQKQLDMLFPGFWLGEVTVDTYKVPEIPDNAKR